MFQISFWTPCIDAYSLLNLQLYTGNLLAYLRSDQSIRYKQLLVYIMPVLTRQIPNLTWISWSEFIHFHNNRAVMQGLLRIKSRSALWFFWAHLEAKSNIVYSRIGHGRPTRTLAFPEPTFPFECRMTGLSEFSAGWFCVKFVWKASCTAVTDSIRQMRNTPTHVLT
jgi:hypothetical protein